MLFELKEITNYQEPEFWKIVLVKSLSLQNTKNVVFYSAKTKKIIFLSFRHINSLLNEFEVNLKQKYIEYKRKSVENSLYSLETLYNLNEITNN